MVSKKVTVFCSSSNRIPEKYFQLAELVGRSLAESNCTLVYGGGSQGLMGKVARTVQQHNAKVIGILPEAFRGLDIVRNECDEVVYTKDLYDRKRMMIDLADLFICLPGGVGTFDELYEILAQTQLGFINKPIGLVDDGAFYNLFIEQLKALEEQNFLSEEMLSRFARCQYGSEIIKFLESQLK